MCLAVQMGSRIVARASDLLGWENGSRLCEHYICNHLNRLRKNPPFLSILPCSNSEEKEHILMSSAAQIEANRRNSQHCTGPVTEAGKQVSKMNALKHGLASQHVVLPHEDVAAFEDLKSTLIAEHSPVGQTEQFLVAQVAETWWRALRSHRVETEYFNRILAPAPADATLLAAILSKDTAFVKIQRYVTTADRAFKSALAHLRQTKQSRYKREGAKYRETTAQPKNGFVPQTASEPVSAGGMPSLPAAQKVPAGIMDGFWLKNPPRHPSEKDGAKYRETMAQPKNGFVPQTASEPRVSAGGMPSLPTAQKVPAGIMDGFWLKSPPRHPAEKDGAKYRETMAQPENGFVPQTASEPRVSAGGMPSLPAAQKVPAGIMDGFWLKSPPRHPAEAVLELWR